MADRNDVSMRLGQLRAQHRHLDALIQELSIAGNVDDLQLRNLKRRKLQMKDDILQLESALIPDLDA